jgi:nucleoside-diphosphate-sugar epimerase
MKTRNILLTGGCGYIGSVLTQKLLQEGHNVTVVDLQWFGNALKPHPNLKVLKQDIRDWDNIPLEGKDVVMHLASVANDPCVELDPKLSWEVNALATMKLADNAARSGVKQFMFAGSGSVYGVKSDPKVTEELQLEPISEYNKTKMVGERILLSYAKDMIVQIVRPGTVCGMSPRMRLDVVVNMLTMQALTKKTILVTGENQIRPNIHIDDMIGVYMHFLEKGEKVQGVYNAAFEDLRIIEIAQKIAEQVPAEIDVRASNDPRSYRMNSDKLLATGFVPQKSVSHAVSEIAASYQKNLLIDQESAYNVKWMKKTVTNVALQA